ncbi:ATP-binding protein [Kutzneria sp. CA-103260]|uniref:ATP-binding protein n=1 Tax=Kutzneria sp. CA-103260 TaxID=2802641 RepID=UPI001BADCE39|nr:tetratricopeptide repeat protein [Kutzneria sp. CA-103260]QUQ65529.1 Bacterial regulatory protein, luxR family [Kutzneria sp. CA-103260]
MAAPLSTDRARCAVCGGPAAAQNGSRYCSNACRQRAYRARVIAAGQTRDDAAQPRPLDPDAPGAVLAPLDSFVGRRPEIERIRQLFRHHRLVTLVGPAGVGKSRLAMEFTRRLPGSWSRGVALVLLDGVDDGDLVSQAVATAVGVRERPDTPIAETLFATLRSSHHALLLDNCEHLVDSCADFVATALRRCGELRVLATSREPLDIPGEAVFQVDGLSVTAPGTQSVDAARLFVDRARALVHDFAITPENAADVVAICAELDGNPLAIELAARWVPVLPVPSIREHLSHRFELLTTNRRSAQSRQVHRSLREAIDWGYELLGPEERVVFRRLSVLTGGFDLGTATAVCADTDLDADHVFQLLGQLRTKSLLTSTEPGQFRQLESVRLYARQRLDASGETDATKERLVAWLAELTAPLARQSLWFDYDVLPVVGAMVDNLLAAVRWTAATDDPRNAVLSIATALGWLYRGHLAEGRKLLTAALARPGSDPETRCLLLRYAGALATLNGDPKEGIELLGQALALSEQLGSPLAEAGARYSLGTCFSAVGRLQDAEDHLTRCVELTADQPIAAAVARQGLAWVALVAGDLDRSAALMGEAVAAVEGRPAVHAICRIYCTAGAVAIGQGDNDQAETYFRGALRQAPDSWWQILAVEGIAVVAQRGGQFTRAVALFGAADAVRHADKIHVEPFWGHQVKESFAVAEQALGRRRVAQIADQARHLTVPQLISYALDDVLPELPDDRDRDLDDGERQVAVLVAEGRTNEQIADQLGISVRTVGYRLRRIRGKLSLSSRAEIRSWLAEHPA